MSSPEFREAVEQPDHDPLLNKIDELARLIGSVDSDGNWVTQPLASSSQEGMPAEISLADLWAEEQKFQRERILTRVDLKYEDLVASAVNRHTLEGHQLSIDQYSLLPDDYEGTLEQITLRRTLWKLEEFHLKTYVESLWKFRQHVLKYPKETQELRRQPELRLLEGMVDTAIDQLKVILPLLHASVRIVWLSDVLESSKAGRINLSEGQRKELEGVLSYLRTQLNPDDAVALTGVTLNRTSSYDEILAARDTLSGKMRQVLQEVVSLNGPKDNHSPKVQAPHALYVRLLSQQRGTAFEQLSKMPRPTAAAVREFVDVNVALNEESKIYHCETLKNAADAVSLLSMRERFQPDARGTVMPNPAKSQALADFYQRFLLPEELSVGLKETELAQWIEGLSAYTSIVSDDLVAYGGLVDDLDMTFKKFENEEKALITLRVGVAQYAYWIPEHTLGYARFVGLDYAEAIKERQSLDNLRQVTALQKSEQEAEAVRTILSGYTPRLQGAKIAADAALGEIAQLQKDFPPEKCLPHQRYNNFSYTDIKGKYEAAIMKLRQIHETYLDLIDGLYDELQTNLNLHATRMAQHQLLSGENAPSLWKGVTLSLAILYLLELAGHRGGLKSIPYAGWPLRPFRNVPLLRSAMRPYYAVANVGNALTRPVTGAYDLVARMRGSPPLPRIAENGAARIAQLERQLAAERARNAILLHTPPPPPVSVQPPPEPPPISPMNEQGILDRIEFLQRELEQIWNQDLSDLASDMTDLAGDFEKFENTRRSSDAPDGSPTPLSRGRVRGELKARAIDLRNRAADLEKKLPTTRHHLRATAEKLFGKEAVTERSWAAVERIHAIEDSVGKVAEFKNILRENNVASDASRLTPEEVKAIKKMTRLGMAGGHTPSVTPSGVLQTARRVSGSVGRGALAALPSAAGFALDAAVVTYDYWELQRTNAEVISKRLDMVRSFDALARDGVISKVENLQDTYEFQGVTFSLKGVTDVHEVESEAWRARLGLDATAGVYLLGTSIGAAAGFSTGGIALLAIPVVVSGHVAISTVEKSKSQYQRRRFMAEAPVEFIAMMRSNNLLGMSEFALIEENSGIALTDIAPRTFKELIPIANIPSSITRAYELFSGEDEALARQARENAMKALAYGEFAATHPAMLGQLCEAGQDPLTSSFFAEKGEYEKFVRPYIVLELLAQSRPSPQEGIVGMANPVTLSDIESLSMSSLIGSLWDIKGLPILSESGVANAARRGMLFYVQHRREQWYKIELKKCAGNKESIAALDAFISDHRDEYFIFDRHPNTLQSLNGDTTTAERLLKDRYDALRASDGSKHAAIAAEEGMIYDVDSTYRRDVKERIDTYDHEHANTLPFSLAEMESWGVDDHRFTSMFAEKIRPLQEINRALPQAIKSQEALEAFVAAYSENFDFYLRFQQHHLFYALYAQWRGSNNSMLPTDRSSMILAVRNAMQQKTTLIDEAMFSALRDARAASVRSSIDFGRASSMSPHSRLGPSLAGFDASKPFQTLFTLEGYLKVYSDKLKWSDSGPFDANGRFEPLSLSTHPFLQSHSSANTPHEPIADSQVLVVDAHGALVPLVPIGLEKAIAIPESDLQNFLRSFMKDDESDPIRWEMLKGRVFVVVENREQQSVSPGIR